jgi:hypothetical protein
MEMVFVSIVFGFGHCFKGPRESSMPRSLGWFLESGNLPDVSYGESRMTGSGRKLQMNVR